QPPSAPSRPAPALSCPRIPPARFSLDLRPALTRLPASHSGVAQSVEQAAVNRRVVGSSPTAGAIYGGPPKGGPPPVHRSPGRKRPGLFLESPSLRRLLRDS